MVATKKIIENIERHIRMEIKSLGVSRVIATVSGGPDSVAMLAALSNAGIETVAAHCNFHLRGEESMRDQQHVEKICARLGVDLMTIDFNVEVYIASHNGVSVEMACRELRHEWFAKLLSELHADRIATGHNADDNIETLFLNLLRGSGTTGLRAMLPDNGKIWRPLLSFHRPIILQYLEEKNIGYVIDSTNLKSDYRRNFLRNEVIPLLRSQWEGFDKALDRSTKLLRDENRVVEAYVEATLPPDNEPLKIEVIKKFPAPELLVRRYIEPLGPFTTTAAEVLAAIDAAKPSAKTWKLRNGCLRLNPNHLSIQ